MGFQQRQTVRYVYTPAAAAAAGAKNYYAGGIMNKQRLMRGFGWAVLFWAIVSW